MSYIAPVQKNGETRAGGRTLHIVPRLGKSGPPFSPSAIPGLRYPTPFRLELLRATDLTILLVALTTVHLLANLQSMPAGLEAFLTVRVSVGNLLLLGVFLFFWSVAFATFGLYDTTTPRTPAEYNLRVVGACSLAAVPTLIPVLSSSYESFYLHTAVGFWAMAIGLVLLLRQLLRSIGAHSQSVGVRRVIIVGSGPRAYKLYRELQADPEARHQVLGFVDSNDEIAFEEIQDQQLGTLEQLGDILMHQVVDEVLIALPIKSCYSRIQNAITVCEQVGVEARYLADIFQSSLRQPRYEQTARFPVLTVKVATDDLRMIAKRLLDVVGAGIGVVLLSPLLLGIAAAIKLSSPGPVFFIQKRYGHNKRLFPMYKFRTMVINAEALQIDLEYLNEAQGPAFKIRNDPRVTRIGKFLRRTSLDELPQLLNVLKGEMSLVGPRPMSLRDVHRFSEPWLMRRFSVVPGMTGLWQVSGRSNLGFDDWIALDLHYIDQWSLRLDCRILLKTIPVVLKSEGAI